jgi:DNA-binding transcriptional LysR family regulator
VRPPAMFDFSQLRCFVSVAEELHFGRAAQRLNMTQSPLSRQIQVLERVLDAKLIDRTSRSVRLTPAGRSFLPEAQRILRLAEAATHVTRQVASGHAGLLRLGFTAASAYELLPRLVRACRTELPEVTLSLREMVSKDQADALLSGQIDAALIRPPVAHPDLVSALATSEALVAALPADDPLARRRQIRLSDLSGKPLITYATYEARYFHDLVVAVFADAGVGLHVVEQLAQIHSILALVRAGLGCALVPTSAESLRLEGVVFRPLVLIRPRPVDLHLAWRRDHANPMIERVLRLVEAGSAE